MRPPISVTRGRGQTGDKGGCQTGDDNPSLDPSLDPSRAPTSSSRRDDKVKDEVNARAKVIADAYWQSRAEKPMVPFVAVLRIVAEALRAGYADDAVAEALTKIEGRIAGWKLENALRRSERRGPTRPP